MGGQINCSMCAGIQSFPSWDDAYNVIEKNTVEGKVSRYFMVIYCTVDGMVLETCILSNIFCVGVFGAV